MSKPIPPHQLGMSKKQRKAAYWRTNGGLLCRYGITRAEYESLQRNQGGKCGICGALKGEKLVIDHDHKTGKVRGLLCQRCNLAIAGLGDDADGLRRGIRYLERS